MAKRGNYMANARNYMTKSGNYMRENNNYATADGNCFQEEGSFLTDRINGMTKRFSFKTKQFNFERERDTYPQLDSISGIKGFLCGTSYKKLPLHEPVCLWPRKKSGASSEDMKEMREKRNPVFQYVCNMN